jgi:hypothetical protein
MPSCRRTALGARISDPEPSRARSDTVTPAASCANDTNSQPKRTVTLDNCSTTDVSSGSSVYCEIS